MGRITRIDPLHLFVLFAFRKPKPGDTVLVHAAAGGVGLLLVQWAKRLGATVIGTVSTDEKAHIAAEAGADHVILYTKQDFVSETKRLTDGRGAQLIIDGVGKSTFSGDLEAVSLKGHIVIFGSASGPADPLLPNSLGARASSISEGSLGNFIATREDLVRRSGGRSPGDQGRMAETSHRPRSAAGRGRGSAPASGRPEDHGQDRSEGGRLIRVPENRASALKASYEKRQSRGDTERESDTFLV